MYLDTFVLFLFGNDELQRAGDISPSELQSLACSISKI